MSLLCCGQQGPQCWFGDQHPSQEVRGGWLLPSDLFLSSFPNAFSKLSSGFQTHPLNRKIWNLERKQTAISCGYGVPKRTFCAQLVGVGVCMSIEMQAEVVTCQWFSTGISLLLPFPMSNLPLHHPVPPVSQRWVEGIKNGRIFMYLCIVFPVLITALQK